MSRHLVERSWYGKNLRLERGDLLLLLDPPDRPLVTVRTRHGRNIKVPLSIISPDPMLFHCQLCDVDQSFPDYATYTAHQIEAHLRDELARGLDHRGSTVYCPFPVCSSTLWPSLDSLVMHYASHHHVMEKLMMYESEIQAIKYRAAIRSKDIIISNLRDHITNLEDKLTVLVDKVEEAEKKNAEVPVPGEEKKADSIREIIQKETETATNIENQTLKMEFLQMKLEKERLAKALESKSQELSKFQFEYEEMSKDQKSTVDMCKQWKEVCLAEEAKFKKEVAALKEKNSEQKKEIENLKSIIEIGKSTVENAKQLSCELAKDNKRRQMKETDYENKIHLAEEKLKETKAERDMQATEVANLNNIVRALEMELERRGQENSQLIEDFKDWSSKCEALRHMISQKDVQIEVGFKELEAARLERSERVEELEGRLRKVTHDHQAEEKKFRKEVENLNQRLEDKSEEARIMAAKIEKSAEDVKALDRLRADLLKARTKYSASLEEGAVEHMKKEILALLKQLEAARKDHSKAKEDAEASQRSHREAVESFRKQEAAYIRDLHAYRADLARLRESEGRMKQLLEATQTELKLAKEERNEEEKGVTGGVRSKALEDLKKKTDMMSAQLKVQQWEIENYKRRLIDTEMTMAEIKVDEGDVKKSMSSPMLVNNDSNNNAANNNSYPNNISSSCSYPNISSTSMRASIEVEKQALAPEMEYQEASADNQDSQLDGRSSVAGSACSDSIHPEIKVEVEEVIQPVEQALENRCLLRTPQGTASPLGLMNMTPETARERESATPNDKRESSSPPPTARGFNNKRFRSNNNSE